ncbi:MAG: hypothetical protein ACREBW_06335 [Candidatus Micrarchaeaceae archaeon]
MVFALALLFSRGDMHPPKVGGKVNLPALTLIDGQRLAAGYFRGTSLIVEYWAVWLGAPAIPKK